MCRRSFRAKQLKIRHHHLRMISWDYEATKSTSEIFKISCMHQVLSQMRIKRRFFCTFKAYVSSWYYSYTFCWFSAFKIRRSCEVCTWIVVYDHSYQTSTKKICLNSATLLVFFWLRMFAIFAHSSEKLKNAEDDQSISHYLSIIENLIDFEMHKARLCDCSLRRVCSNYARWRIWCCQYDHSLLRCHD